jgi:hypothetical protein
MTVSFIGWGIWDTSFHLVCFLSIARAIGSAIMWVNSTLLLQKFTSSNMLGRVLSIDYGLATFSQASSSFMAGYLQDQFLLTETQVCFITAFLASLIVLSWCVYHNKHLGAVGGGGEGHKV